MHSVAFTHYKNQDQASNQKSTNIMIFKFLLLSSFYKKIVGCKVFVT